MIKRNDPRHTLPGPIMADTSIAQSDLMDGATTPPLGSKLETLKELDGKAPARRALNIQTWNTAEGAKVLFVEAHELPMLDIFLTFAAGSSQDDKTPGIAKLTSYMLKEGINGKDANAIAQGFEALGAQFETGVYDDRATVWLRSLSAAQKREPALKLFSEVVGKPTFPSDAVTRMKNLVIASIESEKRASRTIVWDELYKKIYGDHPYAHRTNGNEEDINAMTQAHLKAFHAKGYAAGNAVIAMIGDLSWEEAQVIAAQVSASLPKGPKLAKTGDPVEPKASATHIEFPSSQTQMLLGQLGITRNDPDYAALMAGNSILGGTDFGSRLMTEVREKRGLTYNVWSRFLTAKAPGVFMIELQTRAEMSENTLKLVQETVREFIANGPTQDELDNVKREIIGSFPLEVAGNGAIGSRLADIGFYDLPLSHFDDYMAAIQSLTVQQVKAAMSKHLSADKMIVVTAGPTVPQKELPAPIGKPTSQAADAKAH
ncbi:insulinase family protein [Pseudomonas asturiensis]|uniref:Insulinase family protein n=1 Tax=Pseudomonas asturiensis TaxID=1190415 RepID=A0ABX6H772_9PSED|nr:pitrilysin family protein [Pseudomonas asturiensis]QHF01388.1 insulinase family protein [Pseudomonas asturiensis]